MYVAVNEYRLVTRRTEQFNAGVRGRLDEVRQDEPLGPIDMDRVLNLRTEQRQRVRIGPSVRLTSNDALRPSSARSARGICNRVRPAASVSSVSADGPKNPVPSDRRLDHAPERTRAATRGLKNVPYSAVMINATADTERQPSSHIEVVLHKQSGNREGVTELRHIVWAVGVPFEGDAANNRVTPDGRPHSRFREHGLMLVVFLDFPKLMPVALLHRGKACADESPRTTLCPTAPTSHRVVSNASVYDVPSRHDASPAPCLPRGPHVSTRQSRRTCARLLHPRRPAV